MQYPLLVRFRELNWPESLEAVAPDALDQAFGPGVKLKRITAHITDEPVNQRRQKATALAQRRGQGSWHPDPQPTAIDARLGASATRCAERLYDRTLQVSYRAYRSGYATGAQYSAMSAFISANLAGYRHWLVQAGLFELRMPHRNARLIRRLRPHWRGDFD
ncbi:MAG TPA: hypothetical protein VEZ48_00945 [Sphingomonadaceae bacterium]|nr:hypothetical protein [Sphingomonadaceae bacterium]